ncbi:MAG TPA: hypothetical protein VM914_10460 [Pyrinomonadaceae bacterium]|jgi:hypothetical protein|nr:hypothetical protein [Pyrinomonadaceae bacterium]
MTAQEFQIILTAVQIATTAFLGVTASILAYQQYKFNKNLSSQQLRLTESKLKLDLYERRLDLFMKLRDFASQLAITNEKIDTAKFYHDTIERYFLFDEHEYRYFDEVYEKAKELRHTEMGLQRPHLTDEEEQVIQNRNHDLRVWFFDQSDEMIKVFSNCLAIKTLGQSDSLSTKSSHLLRSK